MTREQVEKLAPGVYVNKARGELHLDIHELLLHFGYQDTPANRQILADEAERQLRALYPGTPIAVE